MSRCARIARALAAALALAAPSALAADFLQVGATAAKTGVVDGDGPAWPDVAWVASLPGSRARFTPPFLIGGEAFVLTADYGIEGLDQNGAFAIDLGTAEIRRVLTLDGPPESWGTDGERLIVASRAGFDGYAVADGAPLWHLDFPNVLAPTVNVSCANPATLASIVYFVCDVFTTESEVDPRTQHRVFVVAIDAGSGAPKWTWIKDAFADALPIGLVPANVPASGPPYSVATGISVVPPNVYAATVEVASRGGAVQSFFWALRESDGQYLWSRNSTQASDPLLTFFENPGVPFVYPPAIPTGTQSLVFLKLDNDIESVNTATGATVWRRTIGDYDSTQADIGSGFALDGDILYATSFESIHRIDTLNNRIDWQETLPRDAGDVWDFQTPLLGGGRVFARAVTIQSPASQLAQSPKTANASVIHALDAESGDSLWSFRYESDPLPLRLGQPVETAIADGVMIVAGKDGRVFAVGTTPASIGVQPLASTTIPAPGATFTVDLGGTTAGAMGPPTAYSADWGDGASTPWQGSPLLSHAYSAPGEVTAVLLARNEAGQIARSTLVLDVGAPAPLELTPLQKAFSAENQDVTFFVVGAVGTAIGGLYGLVRLRGNRRLFRRELVAIESAYERNRDRAGACESALGERRSHVRGLALSGKLTDTQSLLLDKRVEDLLRDARRHAIDARLGYLPHGMVNLLQGMIADGRVSVLERQHFLDALARETFLTETQRDDVRALVDGWFASARDADPVADARHA